MSIAPIQKRAPEGPPSHPLRPAPFNGTPAGAVVDGASAPNWARRSATPQPIPWMLGGDTTAFESLGGPPRTAPRASAARPAAPQPRPAPPAAPVEPEVSPLAPVAAAPIEVAAPPAAPVIPPGMRLISDAELGAREEALLSAAQAPFIEGARRFALGLQDLERGLRDDAIELAKRMAQAILQRELTVDPGLVANVAARALAVLGPVESVTIACAEADAPILEAALPQLSQPTAGHAVALTLQPHAELERGGVLLSFEGGLVDARVDRQLERLLDVIRGASLDSDHGAA